MLHFRVKQQKKLQRQKEAEQLYSSFSFSRSLKQDSVTTNATTTVGLSSDCNERSNSNAYVIKTPSSCTQLSSSATNVPTSVTVRSPSPSCFLNKVEDLSNEQKQSSSNTTGGETDTATALKTPTNSPSKTQKKQTSHGKRTSFDKNRISTNSNGLKVQPNQKTRRRITSANNLANIDCSTAIGTEKNEVNRAVMLSGAHNKNGGRSGSSSDVPQIIVMGPPSSGKTTLLSRFNYFLTRSSKEIKEKLQQNVNYPPILPATSATVGSECCKLEIPENRESYWIPSILLNHPKTPTASRKSSGASGSTLKRSGSFKVKQALQVREVGGKSGCLWSHFLDEPVDVVIYVMDISNMCQIAQAISQIKSMLIDPNLEESAFAFVLNKRDSPLAMSGMRFENTTGLNKLVSLCPNHCITIETSCRTMENIQKLLTWVVAVALNEQ